MQHFHALQDVQLSDVWLTIGAFDGVHTGHRRIIEDMAAGAHAEGVPAVALTFHPHPAVVLSGKRDAFYLCSAQERADLLGKAGADVVITHPFTEQTARQPAKDFLQLLKAHLGFTHLWVGHDFAMGHNREGDIPALTRLGKAMDYRVHVVEPYALDGKVVSSTLIRQLLSEGDVAEAAKLLGRRYRLTGEVERGDGRGRTIGIPTANLAVHKERVVPGSGVYVCEAEVDGRAWHAVTNVGVRPTFENQGATPRVEAHILDFDEDIYGKRLGLKFLARLRGEQRFSGVDALVAQIQKDIVQTREYFAMQV